MRRKAWSVYGRGKLVMVVTAEAGHFQPAAKDAEPTPSPYGVLSFNFEADPFIRELIERHHTAASFVRELRSSGYEVFDGVPRARYPSGGF